MPSANSKAWQTDARARTARCLRVAMALGAVLLGGAGCATTTADGPAATPGDGNVEAFGRRGPQPPHVVAYRDYRDPLGGVNRVVFAFNDVTYRYVLIPVGNGYRRLLTAPVRQRVGNVFGNLRVPGYAVNHLLQLRPEAAGVNLLRFGINTTVGLLGIFDPAAAWFGLRRRETHFGDTLARYGVGYGVYLVLPLYGPADVRNAFSRGVDGLLHPLSYLVEPPAAALIRGIDYLQEFAPYGERYKRLHRSSGDPYIFFRNLYLQRIRRDARRP